MFLKVFSLYDTKTSSFSRPFYEHHDHQAKRGVARAVASGEGSIADYPGDFQLMCLGTFDDNSGSFTSSLPVNLGSCAEIFAAEAVAITRVRNANQEA